MFAVPQWEEGSGSDGWVATSSSASSKKQEQTSQQPAKKKQKVEQQQAKKGGLGKGDKKLAKEVTTLATDDEQQQEERKRKMPVKKPVKQAEGKPNSGKKQQQVKKEEKVEEEEEGERKLLATAASNPQLQAKLMGARFRWLNQMLYESPSTEAFTLFQKEPELFEVYHDGFRKQVEKWPQNPLEDMISFVKSCPRTRVVADFGCGEAALAQAVHKTHPNVHSFDLVAGNKFITACDMSHTPLKDKTVDVAIFCLSLMGTNIHEFLREAARVLKPGGTLRVAEVTSRFYDLDVFVAAVCSNFGFTLQSKDTRNTHFVMLQFVKDGTDGGASSSSEKKKMKKQQPDKKSSAPLSAIRLKPCLYKKR